MQRRLSATPFRTSADPTRYARYVDATLAEWDHTWSFTGQRRVRKIRFRDAIAAQQLLDREVDRLCKPRDGDGRTLLLYGNGASTNIFGKTKKNVKGPARRKKAICIWADEFRTSKLDIYGQPVVHPPETRTDASRLSGTGARSRHTLHLLAPGLHGAPAGLSQDGPQVGSIRLRFCSY